MHTIRVYQLIFGFVLVGLVLSCSARKTPTILPSKTIASTTPTVLTPSPKLMPSSTPTSVDPTFTMTITLRPTISQTITVTPIPKSTLSGLQKSSLVELLLQSYNGCLLPCWWGIVPGSTTVNEARQSLEALGFVIPNEDKNVIGIGAEFIKNQNYGYVIVDLKKNNDVIEQLDVKSDFQNNVSDFRKFWRRFSPELIMDTYGKPTRIWLGLWPDVPPGGPERAYDLLLFYDDKRILIFYVGNTNYEYGYICPSYADNGNLAAQFGMWLSPSENKAPLEGLPGAWIGPLEYYHPIENVSEMSVDEFYNRMLQKKENFCFKIPADKWP
jgi:hypothetical protein